MEILSIYTLEHEVVALDCWKWKHRDCSFFCPGKLIIFKVLTHFHAVNVYETGKKGEVNGVKEIINA